MLGTNTSLSRCFSDVYGRNRCISWLIHTHMLGGLSDMLFLQIAQLWFSPCKVGVFAWYALWRCGHGRWLPRKVAANTWDLSLPWFCKVFMAQLKIFMEFCPVLSNYILEFCSILWNYILELCHLIIQQFGWLWVKTVDDDSGHFVSITLQCGLEKAFREFKEQCVFFS